ncbi:MAG: NuoI/complex I 23 kDa subunit family protein, partial [Myxococcales bacterium]
MAHAPEPMEETALPATGGGRRPEHPVDERRSPGPEADLSFGERLYLREAIKGMVVIANHFFRNLFGFRDPNPEIMERRGPGVNLVSTINYPEERKAYPPGYRGMHRLVPRIDGRPRCVACYMCATACPAQCIYIEAGEYETTDPATESRVIEKFPTSFVIDELRCVVCGLCVDACPKDAIRMDSYRHTPPEYTREGFVYDIPRLLNGAPVSHPSDPWNKREGSEQPEHVHK